MFTDTKTPHSDLEGTANPPDGLPEDTVFTPPDGDQLPATSSTPSDNPTIPETAPTVSFDVNLGKKYKYVDFDYEAYERELKKQGMPSDQKPLTIQVVNADKKGRLGHYQKGTIAVSANKKAQGTLTHEMRHATDEANGQLTQKNRYRIGRIAAGRSAAIATSATGIAGALAENLTKSPLVESLMVKGYGPAIVALGALSLWGYHLHPMERRANRAARQSAEQILTFTKR